MGTSTNKTLSQIEIGKILGGSVVCSAVTIGAGFWMMTYEHNGIYKYRRVDVDKWEAEGNPKFYPEIRKITISATSVFSVGNKIQFSLSDGSKAIETIKILQPVSSEDWK